MMKDLIERYSETIRTAAEQHRSLCIRGSGSKDFYGGLPAGEILDVQPCRGIIEYEPKELVLTARAGTTLIEIEKVLADNGQMLAFEPPHFGPQATLGGCIATGLSGPRRAYQGSARDYVLGVRILDGRGDFLTFGGQVMKNVAGYDVSRLQVGALGTLGLLLEISLKVLPKPVVETTLRFEMNQVQALEAINRWGGQALPLSASCHQDNSLTIRLSGATSAVQAACLRLGGEVVGAGVEYWQNLREQRNGIFQSGLPLWRFSLSSTAPAIYLAGGHSTPQVVEWGGALRWITSPADALAIHQTAEANGGQATLFRGGDKSQGVFHPLPEALKKIHRKLRQTFDPNGVFNIGRMDNC